jgi:ribosome-binding factor A
MSVRFARVERTVYQSLAGLVPAAIRDPRAHLAEAVVVTKVSLAPDFSTARVLVTVKAADDAQQTEVFAAICRAAGHLRRQLGQRLTLRRLPELKFVLDRTPEDAARVEDILRELAHERRARALELGELDDGELDDGELDDGELDDGELDHGELDDGELDHGELDDAGDSKAGDLNERGELEAERRDG